MFARRAGVEDLQDLLDRERAALLEGRFEVLERLAEEKQRLAGAMLKSEPDAGALAAVRKVAERNRDLLSAAREGLRAASARIAGLSKAKAPLATYDATGARTNLAAAASTLQRRA